MLDRKIKDIDADLELLKDRLKLNKMFFFILFITGWIIAGSGIFIILPINYNVIAIGFGICLLIFATWHLIIMSYLIILIKIEKKLGGKKDNYERL